jgi:hypothetical protein
MLEHALPRARKNRLFFLTHSQAFGALLRGVVTQWLYSPVESPETADLLLVEEGCRPPVHHDNVLWLCRARAEEDHRLSLPLSLEALWRQLGKLCLNSLRHHIRIPVSLPATLHARGETTPIQVNTLSDMGLRFAFPRELLNGEQLTVQMVLAGERLSLEGRVIYVIPRGDAEGTGRSEAGVIFDRTPQERRGRIREYIVWRCLELARRQVPEPLGSQGLDFFQLPPAVRQRLAEPVESRFLD